MDNPDFGKFWVPNDRALKEHAKQVDGKFDVPGCKAERDYVLTIKKEKV